MRLPFGLMSLAGAITLWAGAAAAQSFDCSKAATATETAICGSTLLSAFDTEMARVYRAARTVSGESGADGLQAAQREWLKSRNACGADTACLSKAYLQRIDAIWKDRDSLADWTGQYEGPFGENEIDVRQTASDGLEFHLLGGTGNYICDFGPAVARIVGANAVLSMDGQTLTLQRVGTGFYLSGSQANSDTIQFSCGARAPDLTDQFFPER